MSILALIHSKLAECDRSCILPTHLLFKNEFKQYSDEEEDIIFCMDSVRYSLLVSFHRSMYANAPANFTVPTRTRVGFDLNCMDRRDEKYGEVGSILEAAE